MKKLSLMLLGMCVAASVLVSCNQGQSYEDKAKEWLCANVDHMVSINDNHQVLYYPNENSLVKVNLATGVSEPCMEFKAGKKYKFTSIECFFPEDKGYADENGTVANTKFILMGVKDDVTTAMVYNVETETATTICSGEFVERYGDFIVYADKDYDWTPQAGLFNVHGYEFYNLKDGSEAERRIFKGKVGKSAIQVEMCISDSGSIVGQYFYTKYGLTKPIGFTGDIDENGKVSLYSYWEGLGQEEFWEGELKDSTFKGKFTLDNYSKKTVLNFTTTEE